MKERLPEKKVQPPSPGEGEKPAGLAPKSRNIQKLRRQEAVERRNEMRQMNLYVRHHDQIDRYLRRLVKSETATPGMLSRLYKTFGEQNIDAHLKGIRDDLAREFAENRSGLGILGNMDRRAARGFRNSPLALPLKMKDVASSGAEQLISHSMNQVANIAGSTREFMKICSEMAVDLPRVITKFYEGIRDELKAQGVEIGTLFAQTYLQPKDVFKLIFNRLKGAADEARKPGTLGAVWRFIKGRITGYAKNTYSQNGENLAYDSGRLYVKVVLMAIPGKGAGGLVKRMGKGAGVLPRMKGSIISKAAEIGAKGGVQALKLPPRLTPELKSLEGINRIIMRYIFPNVSKIPDPKERAIVQRKLFGMATRFTILPLNERQTRVEAIIRVFLSFSHEPPRIPPQKDAEIVRKIFLEEIYDESDAEERKVLAKHLGTPFDMAPPEMRQKYMQFLTPDAKNAIASLKTGHLPARKDAFKYSSQSLSQYYQHLGAKK